MALQGSFVVVSDNPATEMVEALRGAGGFPIVEADWAEAPAALSSVEPEAVLVADASADAGRVAAFAKALADRLKSERPFMPVLARAREDGSAIDRKSVVRERV